MFAAFYLVAKDKAQVERIKRGSSVASALAVCHTYNEARQTALDYMDENPEIDIYAVMVDPHNPDREVLRHVGWLTADQVEDASMFAGCYRGQ